MGLLLLTALSGCTTHRGKLSPVHGEFIPKKPHWSRAVMRSSDPNSLPDPEALYVEHYHRDQVQGEKDSFPALDGHKFLRFWPNGRFIYHHDLIQQREPTAADADTFGMGTVPGRYSVKDGQITIEWFNMEGKYELRKGTLFPDGIIFYRDHFRGEARYVRSRFPRGAMTQQPDW